jgi:hypothetical protein
MGGGVVRRRRPTESVGTYGITSPGISGRIDTSAPGLGAALSKAQTIAVRLQRELRDGEDDAVTISIRPLGGEVVGRVIVRRDVVETYA